MPTEKPTSKILTGRAVKVRKTCVDEVESLDVVDMRRAGFFDSPLGDLWIGRSRVRGSVVDSEVGYAMLSRELDSARIGIFSAWPPEDDFQLDHTISLTTTAPNFGGLRWWFECSSEGLNKSCLGRVRKLYRTENLNQFRCRECCHLTYASRQEHRTYWHEVLGPLIAFLRTESYRPSELLSASELEDSVGQLKGLLERNESFKKHRKGSK